MGSNRGCRLFVVLRQPRPRLYDGQRGGERCCLLPGCRHGPGRLEIRIPLFAQGSQRLSRPALHADRGWGPRLYDEPGRPAFCLDSAKGTVIWSKDLQKDFGGKKPTWGFAGSPLVEKDWVLCEAGGTDAAVVALDKKTGDVVWKNGKDGAGYSSIVPFDANGERLFAVFASDFFVVRRMKDGSEVGRVPWKTSYGVNAATPIIAGNQIFISSGYDFGCAMLEVGNGLTEVWRNKNMRNHASSCVLWQGCLYGFDESELKCLDFKTGAVKWSEKRYGKGSLALADGKLIVYSQNGKLATVEPSPAGFKEISAPDSQGQGHLGRAGAGQWTHLLPQSRHDGLPGRERQVRPGRCDAVSRRRYYRG